MNDKKLWKVFSEYIRVRDASPISGFVKCFTCPRIKHWKEMDCGHGIGRQHKGTKYHEQNNHAQCKYCNGFNEGMKDVYSKEVDKRYGVGSWDKLKLISMVTTKRTQFEIDAMEKYYRQETARIRSEKKI